MTTAPTLATQVEIFVRCKNLKDKDVTSKSDPFVVIKDRASNAKIGQTEVIQNCLNPDFERTIQVPYFFETKQDMLVEVWDFDATNKHESLGSASFTMGQLMGSRGATLTLKVEGRGEVVLTGSEMKGANEDIQLQFSGHNLKNMDTFGKSDPFFILHRRLPNGSLKQLYKSETVSDNLSPIWKPTPVFPVSHFCGGNMNDQCIVFQCFDEDVTSNDEMGEFVCSMNELLSLHTNKLGTQLKDKKGEGYGMIRVAQAILVKKPSFLDFLKCGLQLNISISIDFTGSNLPPSNPKSLHRYDPQVPNQYIRAILAIAGVVQEYDYDKQFPCFGFGALLPGATEVSHFFHLNLQPNPYLSGIQAVIDTYVQTVNTVRLYGPTNFAPTIRSVTQGARGAAGVYSILLILTDGAITDLDETKNAIVEADDAPLSILIVGVGDADFGSMEFLDSDGAPLTHSVTRKASRRDIVQFVAMRNFFSKPPEIVAAELLKEIPGQVVKWAQLNRLAPEHFLRR